MGPAGTAIGLVTDEVNDVRAFRPVLSSIKVDGKSVDFILVKFPFFHVSVYSPIRINNCAHEFVDLLVRGALELLGNFGSPGGVGVVVDVFNNEGEILGLFGVEQVCDVVLWAELEHLAASFRIIKVDVICVPVETSDFLLKGGEHFVKSLNFFGLTRSGVGNCVLTNFAD